MQVMVYTVDQSTGAETLDFTANDRDLELDPEDMNTLSADGEVRVGGGAAPLFVVRRAA